MSEQELKQLFDNNFDCYTEASINVDGEIQTTEPQAMTKDKFVEVVTKLLQANEATKQPPTKVLPLHGVVFSEAKLPKCPHNNVEGSDGCFTCLDCGASDH